MKESPKQIRRELWDFLREIGVELTAAQHQKVKDIVDYVQEIKK